MAESRVDDVVDDDDDDEHCSLFLICTAIAHLTRKSPAKYFFWEEIRVKKMIPLIT